MMNGKINLEKNRKRENRIFRLIPCILFYGYILFLIWRVFFYAYGSYYRSSSEIIRYNFIPFKTIVTYFIGFYRYPFDIWFFNLFGNVMAFIPLGFFVPIVFKKVEKFKYTIYIGVSMSSCIEILQIITKVGSLDVDDVILNTIGTLIGYIVYKGIDPYMLHQK